MIKKNANASIWEVIPLFALRKMFPQLKFSNEYSLKSIEANTNVNVANRRYDIYSEVINAAIEISRIGAHASQEQFERDVLKQQFSNEAKVTLFHIRDERCDNSKFTNVHTFTIGKNTGDIYFPINSLCCAIEATALDIEFRYDVRRKCNVNYGDSLDEIKWLYKRITGKEFDESCIEELTDKELSSRLNITCDAFIQFKHSHRLSSKEAFILLQNNSTKYVEDGAFLAKNIDEAAKASEILAKKDEEIAKRDEQIQILRNLIIRETGMNIPKKTYTKATTEFEILKEQSRLELSKSRQEATKFKTL